MGENAFKQGSRPGPLHHPTRTAQMHLRLHLPQKRREAPGSPAKNRHTIPRLHRCHSHALPRHDGTLHPIHNDDIAALQSTLSDYELHEHIRFASLKQTYMQTQKIWRILDKNDLTQYYDFVQAYPELYHFVQKETVAKELYKNNPQRLMQALNSLQKEMPDTYRAYLLLMMQHKGNLIDSNQLYTIANGKIIARPEYVDTLSGSEKARGYGEYRLMCREVDTFSVVELYKYAYSDYWKKVLEEDPDAIEDGGDIQIISITNRRCKKTVHIEYFDGWAKSHQESTESYPTEEDCYFVTIPVSPTSVAYLFFSCSYEQFGYVL